MPELFLKNFEGDVIEVDGVCYEFVEATVGTEDIVTIDAVFSTCDACEAALSTSSVSSSGSSSSTQVLTSSDSSSSSSSSDSSPSTQAKSSSSSSSFSSSSSSSTQALTSSNSSSSESAPSFPATNDPQIIVTLTFGGGGTKSFLNRNWASGVPQALQPNSGLYGRVYGETWVLYTYSTITANTSTRFSLKAVGQNNYNLLALSRGTFGGQFYVRRSMSSGNPAGGGLSNNISGMNIGGGDLGTTPNYTINDGWFGPGGAGGQVTVTTGALNGVTIKWERGPDGTGLNKEWKANLP
jgi:hypothetical protein